MKKISILLFWLASILAAQGQDLELLRVQTKVPAETVLFSSDRSGNFYLTDVQGNVWQYNEAGDSVRTFSPSRIAQITLLEALKGIKIWLFYRDFQEYIFLDRFLAPSQTFRMPEQIIGFARLATVAPDNGIWVFDESDFALKKYNPQSEQLLINTPCDLLLNAQEYNLQFLKEYQNLLYLYDAYSGILVFDNLGNYKKKIVLSPEIQNIGWWENYIYTYRHNKITLHHVFTVAAPEEWALPAFPEAKQVHLLKDKLLVLADKKIYLYKIPGK
jgi:hypothetical protein